ncbi:MAG: PEP-CTERM system histidine kinase PrsK [Proteobacteria bacterium]|nr:PEP-CTERM system histidine kinase PrsK [Pseudomonadota bacterium]
MTLAWMLLVVRILGLAPSRVMDPALRPISMVFGFALLTSVVGVTLAWLFPQEIYFSRNDTIVILHLALLLLSIMGLVMIEQLVRNTRSDARWRTRYLTIGLGMLFGFQLVHQASAVLFKGQIPSLYVMYPAIVGLAGPFVALASLRNRNNPMHLNLSRTLVFRTGVLMATGAFLLFMGLGGYYLRIFVGDWSAALTALLATVGIAGLFIVFGSSRVRSRIQIAIARNFFESKYDYRDEWQRVTGYLSESHADYDMGQQAIRAMMSVTHTNRGGIWRREEGDTLIAHTQLDADWKMPITTATSRGMIEFFEVHDIVIDLDDIAGDSPFYPITKLAGLENLRFVVPLLIENRLFGIVGIGRATIHINLNWEDYDLLKLIARQAASFLALRQADSVLAESQQLDTFNRLSAFVIHDIKTISAQLSLLVENSARHRDNPRFIDDMIKTTDNSVKKMTRLLQQLRGQTLSKVDEIDLVSFMPHVLEKFAVQNPAPVIKRVEVSECIMADADKFESVLGHLIQNAIDATPDDGHVTCWAESADQWIEIHVEDSGTGMTDDFVKSQLFRPFASTKGVAGMGIGAYQAREFFRSIGGDLKVTSTIDQGSHFIVYLPRKSIQSVSELSLNG